jgi:hypothetical protein
VAEFEVRIGERNLYTGAVGPVWTEFATAPVVARVTNTVTLTTRGLDDAADPSHAFALRSLRIEPSDECVRELRRLRRAQTASALPEELVTQLSYSLAPAGGMQCAKITARLESNSAGRVGVRVGGHESWSPIVAPGGEVSSSIVQLGNENEVTVLREVADGVSPFRLTELRLVPSSCPASAR